MKKIELFFATDDKFSYVVVDKNGPRIQQLPNGRVMGMIEERCGKPGFAQLGAWQDREQRPTEFVVCFVKI